MKRLLRVSVCVAVAVGCVGVWLASFGAAQDKQEEKITQTAGVDNTRMGAYRALAQLSYQAFQKGDNTTAAELARVLERTWDQGEWHNTSDGSFCRANRSVCQPIDQTMDVFINHIMNYSKKAADPAAVKAAYNNFLEKLKQAE